MAPVLRHFNEEKLFSPDFIQVRDFLVDINRRELHFYDFTWERWEWIFSQPYMDQEKLSYAEVHLSHEGKLKACILNSDAPFQKAARDAGYVPTQDREPNSFFDIAPETDDQKNIRALSLSGPHNDLNIKIAVVAPDGNYASYCGMWYEEGTNCCYVEPVATDPAHGPKNHSVLFIVYK